MRCLLAFTIATLVAASAAAQTGGTTVHVRVGAAPAQSQILVGSDGQTYVGVWVDAPNEAVVTQRAPLDLALLIDTSGSMSGEKIENARIAASSLLESLADGDIASVYTFSNDVTEIAPPTVINRDSRSGLMQRVSSIEPMGGTNLYDGLRVAEASVAQAPPTHPVRRVVVVSDGIANIGPSSPEELGNLVAEGTESGAQVSAIGVGLDYDENTLGALALRSSGRFYHLQAPSQMATILREELQRLSRTVATDAVIDVDPAPGVQILPSESQPVENAGGHYRIRLGSLTAGQHREILLRARVNTNTPGTQSLGAVRFVFRDPAGARSEHDEAIPLAYTVTADSRRAEHSADARVQAMMVNHEASRAEIQAAQLLSRGDNTRAVQVLAAAETQLRAAAAAAPAPAAQQHEIAERIQRLHAHGVSAGRATGAGGPRPAALQMNADAYNAMGL